MVHQYLQNNGYGQTIYVNFIIKCVYYMGLGSNGYAASCVGHPRLDIVMSYNIRGIGPLGHCQPCLNYDCHSISCACIIYLYHTHKIKYCILFLNDFPQRTVKAVF
jgi:hypothetical protein